MNQTIFGKGTLTIEGNKESLDELRGKLHDLGINIQDCLYLELKVNPPFLEELKAKYQIVSEQNSVKLNIPAESSKQVEELFNNSNELKLKDHESGIEFTFLKNGLSVVCSLPSTAKLLESQKIIKSLTLLKLYQP